MTFIYNNLIWINIYKFNKNNIDKFDLEYSFYINFNIKRMICLENNDIIIVNNRAHFGLIKDYKEKGNFYSRKIVNEYANIHILIDKINKAIILIQSTLGKFHAYDCINNQIVFVYNPFFKKENIQMNNIQYFIPKGQLINVYSFLIKKRFFIIVNQSKCFFYTIKRGKISLFLEIKINDIKYNTNVVLNEKGKSFLIEGKEKAYEFNYH